MKYLTNVANKDKIQNILQKMKIQYNKVHVQYNKDHLT
jgi:hypothetical protein